jgi:hypothetical protein
MKMLSVCQNMQCQIAQWLVNDCEKYGLEHL